MSGGGSVTSGTDVLRAVEFEMGAAAAGVAGQESGAGTTMGGASNWFGDGSGGGRSLKVGRSTLHKGSSDPGSKSRKAADGGVSDVKGRSAGVVNW